MIRKSTWAPLSCAIASVFVGCGLVTLNPIGMDGAGVSTGVGAGSTSAGSGGSDPGCVCDHPPSQCFAPSGTCSNGSCVYDVADGVQCDDGDDCTTADRCAGGVCKGMPMVCATPPAPTCVSPTALRTYDAAGTCSFMVVGEDLGMAKCGYSFVERACPSGCHGDTCASNPASISATLGSTCAVLASGAAKCWGRNLFGQLGDGTTNDSAAPVDVVGLSSGVLAISLGLEGGCALTSPGGVKCWGADSYGELGDGAKMLSEIPVDVVNLSSGVIAISVGGEHACALTSASALKCWGRNESGELGNGGLVDSAIPVDVTGLSSGVVSVSAGENHTCALRSAGAVQCWGLNSMGQLGNDSTISAPIPVDVDGLSSGILAVSAGIGHTCALTTAGGVKCWGYNAYGQLGNGSFDDSHVPVDVVGLSSGVLVLSAGDYHTCAVTSSGSVKCWGDDAVGELGNDSFGLSNVPVDVTSLSTGVLAVSAGGYHTCALMAAGGFKCWGTDSFSELGNKDKGGALSTVPIDVLGL